MDNQIELKIIDTSQDGLGVAKLDGLIVFVPYAVEGERVLVDNLENHKNYATARLVKVLTPSPRRANAPCPYYGKCGGCQLMHLTYDTQKLFKQLSLEQTFKREGIYAPINATKGSLEFEFRNNVQLKVQYGETIKLGFYQTQSHELVDIENCLVCGGWFQSARKCLLEFLEQTKEKNKVENIYITCFTQNDEMNLQVDLQTQSGNLSAPQKLYEILLNEFKNVSIYVSKQQKNSTMLDYKTCQYSYGMKSLEFEFLGQKLSLSPVDFFQVNTAQAQNLFKQLKNQIEIIHPEIFVDLFCGIGAFSTIVSPYCNQIYAIDINKNAINKAKVRAKEQNITNINFYAGDCNKLIFEVQKSISEKDNKNNDKIDDLDALIKEEFENNAFSKLLQSSTPKKKVLFLDPSRVGAGKNVLKFINETDFSDVFYLSCNPQSLVKDLKHILDNYHIIDVTPFDMFPQTNKIETLVHLKRTEKEFEIKIEREQFALLTR